MPSSAMAGKRNGAPGRLSRALRRLNILRDGEAGTAAPLPQTPKLEKQKGHPPTPLLSISSLPASQEKCLVEPERGDLGLLPPATGRKAVLAGSHRSSHRENASSASAAKTAAKQMVVVDATKYLEDAFKLGVLDEVTSCMSGNASGVGDCPNKRTGRTKGGKRGGRGGEGRGKGRFRRSPSAKAAKQRAKRSSGPSTEGREIACRNEDMSLSRALSTANPSLAEKSPWFRNFGAGKSKALLLPTPEASPTPSPFDTPSEVLGPVRVVCPTDAACPASSPALPHCLAKIEPQIEPEKTGISLPMCDLERSERAERAGVGATAVASFSIDSGRSTHNSDGSSLGVHGFKHRSGAELVEDVHAERFSLSDVTEGSSSSGDGGIRLRKDSPSSPVSSIEIETTPLEGAFTKHYSREKNSSGGSVASWDGFGVRSVAEDFESTIIARAEDVEGIVDLEVESVGSSGGNSGVYGCAPGGFSGLLRGKKTGRSSGFLKKRVSNIDQLNSRAPA